MKIWILTFLVLLVAGSALAIFSKSPLNEQEVGSSSLLDESLIGSEAFACISELRAGRTATEFYDCIPFEVILKMAPYFEKVMARETAEDLALEARYKDRYLIGTIIQSNECTDQWSAVESYIGGRDLNQQAGCHPIVEYPDNVYWEYDLAVLHNLAYGDAVAAAVLSYRLLGTDQPSAAKFAIRATLLSGKWGPIQRVGSRLRDGSDEALEGYLADPIRQVKEASEFNRYAQDFVNACVIEQAVAKLDGGDSDCHHQALPEIDLRLVEYQSYRLLRRLADEQAELTGDTSLGDRIGNYLSDSAAQMIAFESSGSEALEDGWIFQTN